MERLLRVQQAAEAMNFKVSTIRAWVLHRKIRYVKLGGAIRIPESAVNELVEASTILAFRNRGQQ